MLAGLLAVDPDRGLVVDGLEIKEYPAAPPGVGNAESPLVPDRGHEIAVPDPAQGAFGREGNGDRAVESGPAGQPALLPRIREVDGEVPGPVEVHPLAPNEFRAGIFGPRNGRLGLRGDGGDEQESKENRSAGADHGGLLEKRSSLHNNSER